MADEKLIVLGKEFGDPREQAKNSLPEKIQAKETPVPKPTVSYSAKKASFRKAGATLGSGSMGGSSSSGSIQSSAQSPLYYDYRYSTPDKYYYPRNRIVANSIWRAIYLRDAAVAAATDLYAELPWSEFDLTGIDDGNIRKVYEDMFSELNILPKLQDFARDFLITGELILHTIFNSTDGVWDRVIEHNPDYVRIEGTGLVKEQPLIWLQPTPEIKRLLNSKDPRVRKLQKAIPKEIRQSVMAGRDIPLSELNTTFIARKNNGTDIRGQSIYSRLFRTIMYEDFIVNASLAVAQRNAAPLRIFKLGDPNTGWLPNEDDEAAFAEMLSIAESDPLAAIVMHHNVSCELVGVSDRVLLISKEWDFIERVKLLALGVSKSFLIGEASFASSVAGIQMLMERLSALRRKFTNDWIIKKLCTPIAEINEFYTTTKAQADHRIRVKKTKKDLVVPKIKWKKILEPAQETAILQIWRDLYDKGMLSEHTYASGAGVDLDAERKNKIEETQYRSQYPQIYGVPASMKQPTAMPGGVPTKAPSGAKPPAGGLPMPAASLAKKVANAVREEVEDPGTLKGQDPVSIDEILDSVEKHISNVFGGVSESNLDATLSPKSSSFLCGSDS